jgi:hypothetical protein
MNKMLSRMRSAAGPILVAMILLLAFGTLSVAQVRQYSDKAWSFGVIGDTQWTLPIPTASQDDQFDPSGKNPGFMSASISRQIYQQFALRGAKFVLKLGDNANWGGQYDMDANAAEAKRLYHDGVGLFPIRGNHETYSWTPDGTCTVAQFLPAFPQTQAGGANQFGATNFTSPTELIPYQTTFTDFSYAPNSALQGLSYAFDFGPGDGNATFVMMDVNAVSFSTNPDGSWLMPSYVPGQQQTWIDSRIDKNTRGTTHAFVFSHQGLIGTNHADTMFGSSAGSKTWAQNPFYAHLASNGVKYVITAHDHLYNRSVVKSPDLASSLTQIISAGASTKFYYPPATLTSYKTRETELAQELGNVGFYIYTVDGPRVNVEYYSDATGSYGSDYCWPKGSAGTGSCAIAPGTVDSSGNPTGPSVPGTFITPTFNFVKKDSFGYSLNGKEFLVAKGGSYAVVQDSFEGTTAAILGGTNNTAVVDGNARPITKAVNTGWVPKTSKVTSNILSLWGMADFASSSTDVYALSMTYDAVRTCKTYTLAAGFSKGNFYNATRFNVGAQTQTFVKGAYNPEYGLGTYGFDPETQTVWAVINYVSDFAAVCQ